MFIFQKIYIQNIHQKIVKKIQISSMHHLSLMDNSFQEQKIQEMNVSLQYFTQEKFLFQGFGLQNTECTYSSFDDEKLSVQQSIKKHSKPSKPKKISNKSIRKQALEKARLAKIQKQLQCQAFMQQLVQKYQRNWNLCLPGYANMPPFYKDIRSEYAQKRASLLSREINSNCIHLTFSKLTPMEIQQQEKKVRAQKRLQRQLQ